MSCKNIKNNNKTITINVGFWSFIIAAILAKNKFDEDTRYIINVLIGALCANGVFNFLMLINGIVLYDMDKYKKLKCCK